MTEAERSALINADESYRRLPYKCLRFVSAEVVVFFFVFVFHFLLLSVLSGVGSGGGGGIGPPNNFWKGAWPPPNKITYTCKCCSTETLCNCILVSHTNNNCVYRVQQEGMIVIIIIFMYDSWKRAGARAKRTENS